MILLGLKQQFGNRLTKQKCRGKLTLRCQIVHMVISPDTKIELCNCYPFLLTPKSKDFNHLKSKGPLHCGSLTQVSLGLATSL